MTTSKCRFFLYCQNCWIHYRHASDYKWRNFLESKPWRKVIQLLMARK